MVSSHIVTGKVSSILDDSRLTISDAEFRQLREFIHVHTGIALSEHKKALVCSRLSKRLRHHGLQHYSDYYVLLVENDPEGAELMAMINCITTNKTDFFREPHHFRFLAEQIFPAYKQNPNRERPLRMWSAASSTGEEAYSLAMTALESMPSFNELDIRILATDIDTDVLSRAASGVFSRVQAKQIPEALLRRYFLRGQGAHEAEVMAKPLLKSLVHFHWLNLQEDPWPMQEKFDVIFCRNVLIYFDKPTQQKLFQRMAGALKKDGYLMLGHSEAMHGLNDLFKSVGHSIYQCRGKKVL
ncbi:MAG: protein-glutamate O-methyltransferase CheR [Sulfuricaulis sp.]|nr:protein-glutamate O-methyltransferase CheR [Sulfuricaulis sp.]